MKQIPRRMLVCGVAVALIGGLAAAQKKPAEDISEKRHPNLAAAQRLSREAWQKITAAQKANEWDLDGHAAKAKELLDEVNKELRLAADAANKDHK